MTDPSANILSARDLQFREQTPIKPVWETQNIEHKMLKHVDGNFKRSFGGYYHGGTEGLQGAVPHAYEMFQKIDGINNMTEERKVEAFMQCCLQGSALRHATTGKRFDDAKIGDGNGQKTFKDFLKECIAKYGNPLARQQQKRGLPYCHKPPGCDVSIWKVTFPDANDFIDWLPGTEAVVPPEELKEVYFYTFPNKWTKAFTDTASNNLQT